MMRRHAAAALVAFGGGMLALCVAFEARALWTRYAMAQRLDALTPRQAAAAEAEPSHRFGDVAHRTRREAASSGLIGEIEIRRVGLSAVVLEGDTEGALSAGVGHVLGTAYPGERGNIALAAHRDTYFGPLERVERGDSVWIRTPEGRFGYEIDSVLVVAPDRVDVLRDSGRSELTLVTCYPFYWIGPAPKRYVVRAHPLDPAASPAPVAAPQRTPALAEPSTSYANR